MVLTQWVIFEMAERVDNLLESVRAGGVCISR